MDDARFDVLTRALMATAARRSLLGAALAGAAAALGLGPAAAKPGGGNEQGRKPKPKLNKYGCVDVGKPCRGRNALCCSGICEGKNPEPGKPDRSRCVAHNEASCQVGQDYCIEYVPCGTNGSCFRTTGKAAFCGNHGLCDCDGCSKDKDCEGQFGPGAACVVCESDCVGVNGSKGTACVPAANLLGEER